MKNHIEELMHKELTRKEFLTLVGAGLISVFGFSQALKTLLEPKSIGRAEISGYGGSAYGGQKR